MADIVWLPLAMAESGSVYNEETPWGPLDRDEVSEQVTGVEMSEPSRLLPADLLDAMPAPSLAGK